MNKPKTADVAQARREATEANGSVQHANLAAESRKSPIDVLKQIKLTEVRDASVVLSLDDLDKAIKTLYGLEYAGAYIKASLDAGGNIKPSCGNLSEKQALGYVVLSEQDLKDSNGRQLARAVIDQTAEYCLVAAITKEEFLLARSQARNAHYKDALQGMQSEKQQDLTQKTDGMTLSVGFGTKELQEKGLI